MSWVTEVEGRRFVLTDEQMIPALMEQFRMGNERVADTFAEWVNDRYTPWDALNSEPDLALSIWAEESVRGRQHDVEWMIGWVVRYEQDPEE